MSLAVVAATGDTTNMEYSRSDTSPGEAFKCMVPDMVAMTVNPRTNTFVYTIKWKHHVVPLNKLPSSIPYTIRDCLLSDILQIPDQGVAVMCRKPTVVGHSDPDLPVNVNAAIISYHKQHAKVNATMAGLLSKNITEGAKTLETPPTLDPMRPMLVSEATLDKGIVEMDRHAVVALVLDTFKDENSIFTYQVLYRPMQIPKLWIHTIMEHYKITLDDITDSVDKVKMYNEYNFCLYVPSDENYFILYWPKYKVTVEDVHKSSATQDQVDESFAVLQKWHEDKAQFHSEMCIR